MIPHRIFGLTAAFAVLTLLFWAVEFFWPAIPSQRKLRRGFWTDTLYWFFTPLISKSLSQAGLLIVLVPLMLLLGRSVDRASLAAGYGPILQLPKWVQAIGILAMGDFIGYWSHRWFHGRRLWPFHAVHHSSEDLDWLSAVRLHPVNELVSRLCQAVPFVLLGFSPVVIAAYVPFLTFYSIFVHANVRWTFGPLRYVIATPDFHRWHHTSEDQGLDKNFAGLLPFWDMIFGTFYLPRNQHPTKFGVFGEPLPETFWGQMWYPFRSQPPERVTDAGRPPHILEDSVEIGTSVSASGYAESAEKPLSY